MLHEAGGGLRDTRSLLPSPTVLRYKRLVGPDNKAHARLVEHAVRWLRTHYRCGVILSEQYCATGEVPDVIGWKGFCRSVLIECKVSRADFLADAGKPFRRNPEEGMGCERFYLAAAGVIRRQQLPRHWGLLELRNREVQLAVKPSRLDQRGPAALMKEMNLLLASLRRVELRIEPQSITDFLKWKNRMAEYNGGALPEGVLRLEAEDNHHLRSHPGPREEPAFSWFSRKF
jgi:hypothetical protein